MRRWLVRSLRFLSFVTLVGTYGFLVLVGWDGYGVRVGFCLSRCRKGAIHARGHLRSDVSTKATREATCVATPVNRLAFLAILLQLDLLPM